MKHFNILGLVTISTQDGHKFAYACNIHFINGNALVDVRSRSLEKGDETEEFPHPSGAHAGLYTHNDDDLVVVRCLQNKMLLNRARTRNESDERPSIHMLAAPLHGQT